MLVGWNLWRSPSPTYCWAHKLCLSLAPKCLLWLWSVPTNSVSMLRRRIRSIRTDRSNPFPQIQAICSASCLLLIPFFRHQVPKNIKKNQLRHFCWFDPHMPEQLCVGTPSLSDHCKLIKGFLHHMDNYFYSKGIDSLKNLAQTQQLPYSLVRKLLYTSALASDPFL